jgi:nitroimidazol reductase NimA-like FMN-containing flavoprotein (pyridoxamine 5'-phosphate oxidase superfamily)
MTPQERARRLLDEQQNLVLATVSAGGIPWIAPVFFVPDEAYQLYWTSDREARHSENIRATGTAAIVVYRVEPGQPVDGVYIQAAVSELSHPAEVARAIEIMLNRPQPEKWMIEDPGDVTGDGPWRIYRARASSIEVRASGSKRGKAVALRQPADFRPAA